jgi:hypothetical protein
MEAKYSQYVLCSQVMRSEGQSIVLDELSQLDGRSETVRRRRKRRKRVEGKKNAGMMSAPGCGVACLDLHSPKTH